ncbi:MAG: sulfatase-like hydrolase/transferase [Thermomicrobiales bacterium]
MSEHPNRPNIVLTHCRRPAARGLHRALKIIRSCKRRISIFLGASGTWFRRAYSEVPSCIPARRTLMSGQAPASQGMVGFLDKVEWMPEHTLAGELAKAGYQSEMVGKLHRSLQALRLPSHAIPLTAPPAVFKTTITTGSAA